MEELPAFGCPYNSAFLAETAATDAQIHAVYPYSFTAHRMLIYKMEKRRCKMEPEIFTSVNYKICGRDSIIGTPTV
jgi:hypothetical protein